MTSISVRLVQFSCFSSPPFHGRFEVTEVYVAGESQPTSIILNTHYTIWYFPAPRESCIIFYFLKLSQATPFVKPVKGLLAILWSRLCPLFSLLVPEYPLVNSEQSWPYPQKPPLPFFSPFSISIWELTSLNYQMLQGLLSVMSSCSIEISKGNLGCLAPILGNTQTCSLILSYCSSHCCYLNLLADHAHLLVPSTSVRDIPLLLCCLPACLLLEGPSAARAAQEL